MCFNAETSITAFIVGSIFTALNIHKGYSKLSKFHLLFGYISIFIVIIQLLEFIIWKNLKNHTINNIASLIINIITAYQPVIFILIYSFIYNKKIESLLSLLFIVYIIVHLFNITDIIKSKLVTTIDKSGKLLWPESSLQTPIVYWIILSIFLYKLYKLYNINIRKSLFIVLIVTLFTLWMVYLQKPKSFRSVAGLFSTLWCIFCIHIPIVAYFFD